MEKGIIRLNPTVNQFFAISSEILTQSLIQEIRGRLARALTYWQRQNALKWPLLACMPIANTKQLLLLRQSERMFLTAG